MDKILHIVFLMFGICNISEGTCAYISYHLHNGKLEKKNLSDVDVNIFQDMSVDSFKQISHLLQCYQRFMYQSILESYSPEKSEVTDQYSAFRHSVSADESQFLDGTGKDLDFLNNGYLKLYDKLETTKLEKFDNNLKALYTKSSHNDLCRKLAETYKELALSSENKNDFIKAAFWFRMLYVVGEHSSYLQEYQNMCSKAGL